MASWPLCRALSSGVAPLISTGFTNGLQARQMAAAASSEPLDAATCRGVRPSGSCPADALFIANDYVTYLVWSIHLSQRGHVLV
jgi:hypothetical protein